MKKKYLFFSFIKNKFLRHTLLAFITLFLLFFLWLKYLDIYTMHNQYLDVPDFTNYHISELDSIVNKNNLRFIIIDSIFDSKKENGVVVNQDPKPSSKVKKNRKIYLTITSLKNRKVIFPDIYDLTLRQAVRELNTSGLEIGKLEYIANLARNKVLNFTVNGIPIKHGQEIFEGTTIDLVIGKGLVGEDVMIPNLIGLSRIEANIVLKSASLNIGVEVFKENIQDSSSVIVYKQSPVAGKDRKISLGSSINIFYQKPSQNTTP